MLHSAPLKGRRRPRERVSGSERSMGRRESDEERKGDLRRATRHPGALAWSIEVGDGRRSDGCRGLYVETT